MSNKFNVQVLIDRYYPHAPWCHYCGAKDRKMTVDHKQPKSKGGRTIPSNLVPCCEPCNKEKKILNYEEYLAVWKVRKGELNIPIPRFPPLKPPHCTLRKHIQWTLGFHTNNFKFAVQAAVATLMVLVVRYKGSIGLS